MRSAIPISSSISEEMKRIAAPSATSNRLHILLRRRYPSWPRRSFSQITLTSCARTSKAILCSASIWRATSTVMTGSSAAGETGSSTYGPWRPGAGWPERTDPNKPVSKIAPASPRPLTLVAGVTEDTILDQIGLLSHLRCTAHHIGFGSMGADAAAHKAATHRAAAHKAAAHEAAARGGALAHVAA
jgi:hypothetical protein